MPQFYCLQFPGRHAKKKERYEQGPEFIPWKTRILCLSVISSAIEVLVYSRDLYNLTSKSVTCNLLCNVPLNIFSRKTVRLD